MHVRVCRVPITFSYWLRGSLVVASSPGLLLGAVELLFLKPRSVKSLGPAAVSSLQITHRFEAAMHVGYLHLFIFGMLVAAGFRWHLSLIYLGNLRDQLFPILLGICGSRPVRLGLKCEGVVACRVIL